VDDEPRDQHRADAPNPPPAPSPEGDGEPDGPHPFGLFPIIVLIVVIAGGLFLVFELRDISNVQDCVWSGRKNCVPVDVPGR
jgi:hypothetical protein